MYAEALYGQHEGGVISFATFVFFRVKMRHTMCRFRVRGPHPICLCKKVGVAHRWCRRTCHTWVQGREIDLQRTFRSILCSTVKPPPLNTEHVLDPRELGLPPSFRSSISMVRTTRPHAAIRQQSVQLRPEPYRHSPHACMLSWRNPSGKTGIPPVLALETNLLPA